MLNTINSKITRETQTVAMLTFTLLGFVTLIRIFRFLSSDTATWVSASTAIVLYISITLLLWRVTHSLRAAHLYIIIIAGPVLSFLCATLHIEMYYLLTQNNFSWVAFSSSWKTRFYLNYLGSFGFLTWYLGYFTIVYTFRFQREVLAAIDARRQADQAQLQMLRTQLNPHFLFNTLNSISALVLDHRNDRAESMVGSLSQFLRFSLDDTQNTKTPLSEELNMIREYLKIEKIRFSNKLQTQFEISEQAGNCLVPSLILQPAVENAIKHAIAPMKENGYITVTAAIIKNHLHICVNDNGPGIPQGMELVGVGIQNMRERLQLIYNNAANLTLSSPAHEGLSICLTLPIETRALSSGET